LNEREHSDRYRAPDREVTPGCVGAPAPRTAPVRPPASTRAPSSADLLADGAAPHPADVLQAALDQLLEVAAQDDGDLTLVAVQAWGEAVRGGQIHDMVKPRLTGLHDHWVEVARRHQAAGGLGPDADPEQVGRALLGLIPGFILQRLLLGEVTPDGYAAGLRAMLEA
jgi:hypothetical protein